jgi:hypothetical protein
LRSRWCVKQQLAISILARPLGRDRAYGPQPTIDFL